MTDHTKALADATERLLNAVYLDWPNTPSVRSKVLADARAAQAALNAYRAAPSLTVGDDDGAPEVDWLDSPDAIAAWNRIRKAAIAIREPGKSIADVLNAADDFAIACANQARAALPASSAGQGGRGAGHCPQRVAFQSPRAE